MARGGYRPGSGPQKGTKYGPRKPKEEAVAAKKERKPKNSEPATPEEPKAENLDPLSYMLGVMNNPDADQARRDRMAVAAAPFCHARKGEGAGKKQEKDDKAKAAGVGRFASGAAPLKVVK